MAIRMICQEEAARTPRQQKGGIVIAFKTKLILSLLKFHIFSKVELLDTFQLFMQFWVIEYQTTLV